MSCSNANYLSSSDIETVFPPFPGDGWRWQIPLSWLARIARGCERRHQRRQLLELDDRLLAGIGVSRQQAVAEALKSSLPRALMLHNGQ